MSHHTLSIEDQVAQMVRDHKEFNKVDHCFVSIYRVHQHYGGSEEGGWWYNRYKHEGSIRFANQTEAHAWIVQAENLVRQRNEEEAPDRYITMASLPDCEEEGLADYGEGYIPTGWDDGGRLIVVIDEVEGEMDNTNEPRPRYE